MSELRRKLKAYLLVILAILHERSKKKSELQRFFGAKEEDEDLALEQN